MPLPLGVRRGGGSGSVPARPLQAPLEPSETTAHAEAAVKVAAAPVGSVAAGRAAPEARTATEQLVVRDEVDPGEAA